MTRSRTPDVETLACAVAGGYAGRWARSVARQPPPGDAAEAPGPWLVDGFAGADLQRAALRGVPAHPPAAALLRAADEASARLVLVEEDPGLLARVENELRAAGAGDRLRRAADPADAQPGDVVLVEAPFATVAGRLAAVIGDGAALVRVAPLTARGLPWAALELLADLDGADLLLRVPGEDFGKAGRFTGPLADFPPHLRRVVEGCSALLADERHGWLPAWREALRAEGEDAALAALVERLRARLGNGVGRMARAARLESADSAVHLLLTTPHPQHALELNGAVMDASGAPPAPAKAPKSAGRARSAASAPSAPASAPVPADAPESAPPASPAADPAKAAGTDAPAAPSAEPGTGASPARRRSSPRPASTPPGREPEPVREAEPTVLDLFAIPAPPAPEPPRGPDLRAAADELHARHVGRRVPLRELLGDLADAGLAPEQVRTALGLLKRERRAVYRSLDAEGAEVEFRDPPAVAPAPPPVPRPRKRPAPLPGVLGLFDEPQADDVPSPPGPSEPPEPEQALAPPPSKKPRRRKAE